MLLSLEETQVEKPRGKHSPALPITRQAATKQPLVCRSQKGHWRSPSPNRSTYTPTYLFLSKFPSNFIRHCTRSCKTQEQTTDCEDSLSNSARSPNLKQAFPLGNVPDSAHSSAIPRCQSHRWAWTCTQTPSQSCPRLLALRTARNQPPAGQHKQL